MTCIFLGGKDRERVKEKLSEHFNLKDLATSLECRLSRTRRRRLRTHLHRADTSADEHEPGEEDREPTYTEQTLAQTSMNQEKKTENPPTQSRH